MTSSALLDAPPLEGDLFPDEEPAHPAGAVPRDLAAGYLHELAAAFAPGIPEASRRERLAGLLAVARHWEGGHCRVTK